MPPGVHVESLPALADLERALARFAAACQDRLPEVRREAERRLAVLESVCREREREAEQWRESYDHAGEDEDTGYLAYRMEQAQDALHQARHWQRRCEESCQAYARQARQLESLAERDIAQARDFLRRKIEEIQEYRRVSFNAGGTASLPVAAASFAPATTENDLAQLMDNILPDGFQWVTWDEINPRELAALPPENDYPKVTYADMKQGLEMLRAVVLPALQETNGNADSDYFRELDRLAGRDELHGARKIFAAFFSRVSPEFVRVERFAGAPHYDITNGRHRIKAARDLGWPGIPAETIEVPQKTI